MSSDRTAVDRVYEEVKGRILSGSLRLQERVDVERLSRAQHVSATPVRQALICLVSERLLISHPTRGYHVALWSEQELRDLYAWRGKLADLSIDMRSLAPIVPDTGEAGVYADQVTALLQQLNFKGNSELVRASINADERLRAARLAEPHLFHDCEHELLQLRAAVASRDRRELTGMIDRYFQRRTELAGEIRAQAVLRALPTDER